MMTVLSKFTRPPGYLEHVETLVNTRRIITPAFFEVETPEIPQSYMKKKKLEQVTKQYGIVHCVSSYATWYLGYYFGASSENMRDPHLAGSLACCIGPREDNDLNLILISPRILWKHIFTNAESQHLPLVC